MLTLGAIQLSSFNGAHIFVRKAKALSAPLRGAAKR
jgi:hypothetical protein